jgi:hypothetical protein
MCFSATASFTAAAVVGSIGIATLWKAAGRRDYAVLPIAAFPALFAAQQGLEGLLWLDLARSEPSACRTVLVHGFLGYAQVFWPVFAPLAVWLIEPSPWRRRLMLLCLAVGVVLATYLLAMMIAHPYTASVVKEHIRYSSVVQEHIRYSNGVRYPTGIEVPYVLASSVSLLLSSHWSIRLLALVVLAGFAVAKISFRLSYISVWCFFGAAASVLIYLFVSRVREPGQGRAS